MTKFGKRRDKKRLRKRQISDYQLKRQNLDKYNKLIAIGFNKDTTEDRALKKLKEGYSMSSVEKLNFRYETFKNQPGVTSISLQGIKRSVAVEKWIAEKTKKGLLIDRQFSLYFPPDPKLIRYKIL